MYINKKTFEVISSNTIPKGIDWIKIPKEAEECYYFDGSDPDVAEDLLFYTKDLEATWTGEYWSDNTKCISPTYYSIKKYVKEHGRLVWCKEQLMDNEEIKTVKYLNRKTHEVFESSEDLDNDGYLLLPNDVETIVGDSEDIILFKVGYSCCVFENCIFSGWGFDEYGLEHYLEKYPSLKVIWSKSDYSISSIDESGRIDKEKNTLTPIKSDGGSSGYYFTKLPKYLIAQIVETGGIEIKDIVRYCFDNDADCKDIIKALKRINESKKGGGKEGITIDYDLKKIGFFYNEMVNAHLKTKEENV